MAFMTDMTDKSRFLHKGSLLEVWKTISSACPGAVPFISGVFPLK